MASTAELVARSSDLKRALVEYGQRPRYQRAFREALQAQNLDALAPDDQRWVMFLDYFVLQHRFRNGRGVIEQFVAAHPDLTEDEREMLLGWHEVVEGIFEVREQDGDVLVVQNLIDELTYRVRSNAGPQVFEKMPPGSFLITRLIPVLTEWLISGATAVVPGSQRAQVRQRAADLARRQPALLRRNPDKRPAEESPEE
jgi:hypothetical protein